MSRLPIVLTSLTALAGLSFLLSGCGKPPATGPSGAGGDERKTKAQPWENVASRLRKETDLAACKTALGQLNNELSERSDLPAVPSLSDDAATALKALVPLSPSDLSEVRGSSFSSLDPAYLAECFHLRDAARSLDPTGLPPVELARLGFDWVCRQVYVQPWVLEREGYIPAVPPSYVLRRGSGSGLERAYVFLALLQQLGFDACLIGSAGAQGKSTLVIGSEGKSTLTRGPFWAVGVRNGADVVLFNPWRGEAFPAPDGKGIGTLAQVKANPSQLKAWLDDKANPWDVSADEVKQAAAVLAVPLSALAPRLSVLEQKIQAETGVRLAIDAAALKARFAAAAPNGPGLDARFWNPAGDRFTYTRMLIAFLPVEEGGLDSAEPEHRPHRLYFRSLYPTTLIGTPKALKPQLAERLQLIIFAVYESAFVGSQSPRELIQRGQFQDAAREVTQKIQIFGRGIERLRQLNAAEVDAWCEAANAAFDNLNSKRYPNPGQIAPQPDTDPDVIEAKSRLEEFWRSSAPVVQLLIDRATASLGRNESLYLLALAKHEEAEARQSRGAADALDSWHEAANAWSSFLEQNSTAALESRTNHAKKLAARARKFADAK